jgi:hypothetical protein
MARQQVGDSGKSISSKQMARKCFLFHIFAIICDKAWR